MRLAFALPLLAPIDAGNVDPEPMAISESWIYWTRDGQPFSAPWT